MSTDILVEESPETGETPTPPAALSGNEAPPTPPELPSKFEGKSMQDVVTSYLNLEKEFGRSRQELGELRQLADSFIQREVKQAEVPAVTEKQDFFDNPEQAVEQTVRTALKPIESELAQARAQVALHNLQAKHADMGDVVHSEEFQRWIKESPVRTKLYTLADKQYDADIADELLTTFKALRSHGAQQAAQKQDTARKAATLESGGTGETGKKVWRRSDLINMRLRNPDKYASLQDEIMQAYQEGRVR